MSRARSRGRSSGSVTPKRAGSVLLRVGVRGVSGLDSAELEEALSELGLHVSEVSDGTKRMLLQSRLDEIDIAMRAADEMLGEETGVPSPEVLEMFDLARNASGEVSGAPVSESATYEEVTHRLALLGIPSEVNPPVPKWTLIEVLRVAEQSSSITSSSTSSSSPRRRRTSGRDSAAAAAAVVAGAEFSRAARRARTGVPVEAEVVAAMALTGIIFALVGVAFQLTVHVENDQTIPILIMFFVGAVVGFFVHKARLFDHIFETFAKY